jgi:predicted amidophosphoribosyltransferase
MHLPGASIPVGSLVACADCEVAFDTSESACPRCGSEIGIHPLLNGRAAKLIETQRNLLDEAEGVLNTLARRGLGSSSLIAERMRDRIREDREKGKAPVAPGAHEKGATVS